MTTETLTELIEQGLLASEIAERLGQKTGDVYLAIYTNNLNGLYKATKKPSREKTCTACGLPFYDESKPNNRKFCSTSCKPKHKHKPRGIARKETYDKYHDILAPLVDLGYSIGQLAQKTGIKATTIPFAIKRAGLYDAWKAARAKQ